MALIGSLSASSTYSVDFLCIAGGGGGGAGNSGGGGGAGGYRNSYASETSGAGAASELTPKFTKGAVYNIQVGTGGASKFNGENSHIQGIGVWIESIGGGTGGHRANWPGFATGAQLGWDGRPGGSGGGGGTSGANVHDADDETSGGMATVAQGHSGGRGIHNPGYWEAGGGGGGANARGQDVSSGVGGYGGAGLPSAITTSGSTVTRGGGGGGAGGSAGAAGAGGGGAGTNNSGTGATGGANTGGGAGGRGGTGGSGVVIIRMTTANYSGTSTGAQTPIVVGSDTILVFNGDGTYTA